MLKYVFLVHIKPIILSYNIGILSNLTWFLLSKHTILFLLIIKQISFSDSFVLNVFVVAKKLSASFLGL